MEKKRTMLASTAILAGAMIFTGYQIKVPYKQQIPNQQGITNTINVAGDGKSYASPDTLTINASVSELGKTTKEAQDQMDTKITKLKEVLASFSIPKEKLQTTNLNINPEYDRSNNQRKTLGYRAQQSVSIEIQGDGFAQKGANIIDKIANIGNINIDGSSFSLKNKNKAMQEAREKAFEDAKEKATQLAKLGGVNLGKPTMITDQEIQSYQGPVYAMQDMKVANGEGTAMNASPLSQGQIELDIKLQITYEIK